MNAASGRRTYHRVGRVVGALAAVVPFAVIASAALIATEVVKARTTLFLAAPPRPAGYVAPAFVSLLAFATAASFVLFARARKLAPGTAGRSRLTMMGSGALLAAFGGGGAATIFSKGFRSFAHATISGSVDAVALGIAPSYWGIFVACCAVAGLGLVLVLAAEFGLWFLLPATFRARAWATVDLGLFGAFAFATHTLPFVPASDAPGDVRAAALRLGITAVFGVRMIVRLIPVVLEAIERATFQSLVAARMLRAGKSGFLTVIGMLSILAVSVSSCALTVTLSVMGGFRGDLRRKILGQNAHIVVDRDVGRIEGWQAMLTTIRAVDGVRGASPFASGEVMVSSATNRAGAVLRGIDPASVNSVTDLERNLQSGKLEYLESPARLLEATRKDRSAVRGGSSTLLRDIDRALDEARADAARDDDPRDDGLDDLDPFANPRANDALPGAILGRELARSLRVFVGDEIDVVSPLGDLGPTGPMPKSRAFRVAGIFYSGMYEFDMKFAYVALPAAQEFLATAGAISGIEVKTRDVERAPLIADRIRRVLADRNLRVRDWQELNKNLFGALALEKVAMFVVLGVAILVASFCIFASLMLMVQEKARQVGILKALGTPSSVVVRIFVLEGFFIGFFGAVTGLGAGYVLCFAAEHLGVRINPEVYYIDKLPVHVDLGEFAAVGLTALLMGTLVTLLPATLASRLNPIDALRYE
jgi:lipoprotein-releasing system permease protein